MIVSSLRKAMMIHSAVQGLVLAETPRKMSESATDVFQAASQAIASALTPKVSGSSPLQRITLQWKDSTNSK